MIGDYAARDNNVLPFCPCFILFRSGVCCGFIIAKRLVILLTVGILVQFIVFSIMVTFSIKIANLISMLIYTYVKTWIACTLKWSLIRLIPLFQVMTRILCFSNLLNRSSACLEK